MTDAPTRPVRRAGAADADLVAGIIAQTFHDRIGQRQAYLRFDPGGWEMSRAQRYFRALCFFCRFSTSFLKSVRSRSGSRSGSTTGWS